ncbi:hypothetical protein SK128_003666, partial [Halocaridina rubra]
MDCPTEIVISGTESTVLEQLWLSRENGINLDLRIVHDEGVTYCHRLAIMSSPILREEMRGSHDILLPYLSLTEIQHFIYVIYGRPFTMSYTRLQRLRTILARYRVPMPPYQIREVAG